MQSSLSGGISVGHVCRSPLQTLLLLPFSSLSPLESLQSLGASPQQAHSVPLEHLHPLSV